MGSIRHLAAALVLASGHATAGAELPALNADIAQSSVSGLSSGAFMAVQFGTAWSSVIAGVGVIAGGPFYCAQASSADILDLYARPLLNATGPCMSGPPPAMDGLIDITEAFGRTGDIDPPSNLAKQKVYVFHGTQDRTVNEAVTQSAVRFYQHYRGAGGHGQLFYQDTLAAGHAQIVTAQPGAAPCDATQAPYIDACGYDQAGILLQHIYGALNPPNTGTLAGRVVTFTQASYTVPFSTTVMSLGETGFAFIPAPCAQGAPCRVHIALHGCTQDAGEIGRTFVDGAGYNAWADTNGLIVLYPQTAAGTGFGVSPFNPEACWDWFGYVNQDASYVTKTGRQISAIKAMLDAVTAGAAPAKAAGTTAGPPAAPEGVVVTDLSRTSAAVAWRAVPGAAGYRVYRAGGDGAFTPSGETQGSPSFADTGLAAGTSYSWKVAAVIDGTEGPPSAATAGTTMAAPVR